MFKMLIIVWLVVAAGLAVAAALIPSVEINGGVASLLWVALLFGLVNALIGPLLRLISLPLTVLTLGLFALVVNGALLGITAAMTDSLNVGGAWPAIGAAFIISAVTAALMMLLAPVLVPESE